MRMNFGDVGHNFLIYDGVNLSDHFVVRTVDMPLLPTIDARTVEIDGKPGAWFSGRQIGTRDITVGLGILADSRDRKSIVKAWADLSDKLAKDKVCKLEIGNGLFVNAFVVGDTPTGTNGRWSTTEVTFRCFDPYIYGREHTVPLAQGNNTFPVHGKVPTYPVIEITGASTTTVTYKETDDRIRVERIPKSPLVIDMANHVCKVGGDYAPADPTVSDFWPLKPGTATVNVTSGTGTLTYREVFL